MQITSIETYRYWASWCNWLFVKVCTDEGIHGWGEGSLHGAIESVETAVHELKPVLIGQDPSAIERHWQEMYTAWRWRGGPTLMTALSAIDIALWDIEGKRLGVPVSRLLGGPFRQRLRGYASHWLSGVETRDQAREAAAEAVRRGFTAFKWTAFDPGRMLANERATIGHYASIMQGAREGAGDDVEIYVECAERLSPRTLPSVAEAFHPYRPGWFEEPVPFEDASVMGQVRRETSIPIATGERLIGKWEFLKLFREGGCHVAQPDVMHTGGITEMKKIASLADMHCIPVAPHNPAGPICMLATMHLAASIPNFLILEQMEDERALRDSICTAPVKYKDGFFELPDAPGLGTDLVLENLKGHAFRPQPVSKNKETLWR